MTNVSLTSENPADSNLRSKPISIRQEIGDIWKLVPQRYASGDQALMPDLLVEGIDFYYENGLMVFTAEYLKKRGFCCRSGCRHCPYGFKPEQDRDGAEAE